MRFDMNKVREEYFTISGTVEVTGAKRVGHREIAVTTADGCAPLSQLIPADMLGRTYKIFGQTEDREVEYLSCGKLVQRSGSVHVETMNSWGCPLDYNFRRNGNLRFGPEEEIDIFFIPKGERLERLLE